MSETITFFQDDHGRPLRVWVSEKGEIRVAIIQANRTALYLPKTHSIPPGVATDNFQAYREEARGCHHFVEKPMPTIH